MAKVAHSAIIIQRAFRIYKRKKIEGRLRRPNKVNILNVLLEPHHLYPLSHRLRAQRSHSQSQILLKWFNQLLLFKEPLEDINQRKQLDLQQNQKLSGRENPVLQSRLRYYKTISKYFLPWYLTHHLFEGWTAFI